MLKAIIRRIGWMLSERKRYGKLPRCAFKNCSGFATHTFYAYQGDDLRDIDVCWRHGNKPTDAQKPNPCPHGWTDWDDCPDCRH